MNEPDIEHFWDTHPCGESLVGGVQDDYAAFFDRFDTYRYEKEGHILEWLDRYDWRDQRVLEIGLGQGADAEQLVRRGAIYSGLDLTQTAVDRVKTRFALRDLPYEQVVKGSALQMPFDDDSFDRVYSFGVLHHIPDILTAQREIHRVLRPGGQLLVMLYAKRSLNYLLSIAVLRRLGLLGLAATGMRPGGAYDRHLELAREEGLLSYLRMRNFVHRNTDGPDNVYAKVYSRADVRRDFPLFEVESFDRGFVHAPPLPSRLLPRPVGPLLGWHLWVTLRAKAQAR